MVLIRSTSLLKKYSRSCGKWLIVLKTTCIEINKLFTVFSYSDTRERFPCTFNNRRNKFRLEHGFKS